MSSRISKTHNFMFKCMKTNKRTVCFADLIYDLCANVRTPAVSTFTRVCRQILRQIKCIFFGNFPHRLLPWLSSLPYGPLQFHSIVSMRCKHIRWLNQYKVNTFLIFLQLELISFYRALDASHFVCSQRCESEFKVKCYCHRSHFAPNTQCSDIVRHLCCCSDGEHHHAETHSIFRHNQMIPHESHLRFMMCSNVRMNMLYVKTVIVKLCLSVDLFLSFSNTFSLFLFVVVFYHCTK